MEPVELNNYKMELLRQIVHRFNSETSLHKLGAACRIILNQEDHASIATMPPALLKELMDTAARQAADGMSISDEQLAQLINQPL